MGTLSRNLLLLFSQALLCALVLTNLSLNAPAQENPPDATDEEPVVLILSADRTEILVGERVNATLRIQWSGQTRVAPVTLPETLGAFEILEQKRESESKTSDNSWERIVRLTATSFEIGSQELGPFEVAYTLETGNLLTVSSRAIPIEVKSVLPPEKGDEATTATLRPLRPPFEIPFDFRLVPVIGGIVFTLLLILAFVIFRLTRRKRAQAPQAEFELEPAEQALRAFAEMETSRVAENESAKEFYTQLSLILRRYYGRRYEFDALEMTSSELLEALQWNGWGEDLCAIFTEDSRESDAVKFARYVPNHAKRQAALARGRQIVVQTRPAEIPDPSATAVNDTES